MKCSKPLVRRVGVSAHSEQVNVTMPDPRYLEEKAKEKSSALATLPASLPHRLLLSRSSTAATGAGGAVVEKGNYFSPCRLVLPSSTPLRNSELEEKGTKIVWVVRSDF